MQILMFLLLMVVLPFFFLIGIGIIVTTATVGIVSVVAPFALGGLGLLFLLGLIAYPFKDLINEHQEVLNKWGERFVITAFSLTLIYHIFYVW
ncbi:hypothetical protein A4G18_07470 [Pasteurellaceae bacterium Pebbles2]|nr:hypothetical protein [Pasteurellaceae bacterium Pebbles2]